MDTEPKEDDMSMEGSKIMEDEKGVGADQILYEVAPAGIEKKKERVPLSKVIEPSHHPTEAPVRVRDTGSKAALSKTAKDEPKQVRVSEKTKPKVPNEQTSSRKNTGEKSTLSIQNDKPNLTPPLPVNIDTSVYVKPNVPLDREKEMPVISV